MPPQQVNNPDAAAACNKHMNAAGSGTPEVAMGWGTQQRLPVGLRPLPQSAGASSNSVTDSRRYRLLRHSC